MSSCNSILTGAAMANCPLPKDVMVEILCRLSVKTRVRFRCVCKPWRSLTTNPCFITKHLTQTTTHNINDEHVIMRSKSFRNKNDLISMLLQGKKILLKLPFGESSNSMKITASCNALLCCFNSSSIFLWNPTTREYRNLPEPGIPFPESYVHSTFLGLGLDAKADDYKLVRLLCYKGQKPPLYKAEVYSKKKDFWKEINVDLQCRVSDPHTVFGGVVHWIASGSDYTELIAYFDLHKEVFGEIQLPVSSGFGTEIGSKLAVVNDLLAVMVHPLRKHLDRCVDVWVMKEYGVKKSWTKLLSVEPFSSFVRRMSCSRNGRSASVVPMACFKNGRFVVQNYKENLFLYNSSTQEIYKLPVGRAQHIYEIYIYTETLVSVRAENKFQETNLFL